MSLTRIGSIGINTGIAFAGVTTIVTLNTANDALSIGATVNVGSGITLGASGDIFATGVSTVTTLKVGSGVTVSSDGDVFFTGIATGNGSGLTALNASNISSGTVPTARLGSGTASSSTFLRGDSTFQTVNTDLVSDTSPQLGGDLASNGNDITMADTDKVILGTGSDLSIYHQSTQNFIRGSATASPLYIDCCENLNIRHLDTDGSNAENMIRAIGDGAVELYYDNSKKFETYTNGCTVTGNLNAGNVDLADSAKARFGTSNDLEIYHDGSNTLINNSTGELKIGGDHIELRNAAQNSTRLASTSAGALELYYNNSKKYETTSTGATQYGNLTIPDTDAKIILKDGNNYIQFLNTDKEFKFMNAWGAGEFTFYPGGSERVRINPNGLLFNGDTASANALDDYEEGTYTPTDASGAGLSLTINTTAAYTKIGRMMYVQFDITWPSNSNTTDASITMPTGLGLSVSYGGGVVNWTDNGNPLFIHVGSKIYIMDNNNSLGNSSQHAKNNEISGKRLIGSVWYIS